MIRKWDIPDKALSQKCIDGVITRVQDIDDPAHVGMVAAQDIIDIVLETMGPEIYNKAISDTTTFLKDKFSEIEYGAEDLKQS